MADSSDNQVAATGALLGAIQDLGRRARLAGLSVSPAQLARLVRSVELVGAVDRPALRRVVRLCLATSAADGPLLDALTDLTFPAPTPPSAHADRAGLSAEIGRALRSGDLAALQQAGAAAAALPGPGTVDDTRPAPSARNLEQRVLRALDISTLLQRAFAASADTGLERRLTVSEAREGADAFDEALLAELRLRAAGQTQTDGADEATLLAQYLDQNIDDISLLRASPRELVAMRAALQPLARKLAARSRRLQRRRRGRLAVRPTMRRALATGGVPLDPVLHRISTRRPRLVVLCDVSGSMAEVSRFTLTLLYAMRAELPTLRAFAFVDGTAEITDLLASGDGLLDARVLATVPGLVLRDGHSDYGQAFQRFVDGGGRTLSRTTTVMIIGDARARGLNPGVAALRTLRARVRRIVWCNPEPRHDWDTGDSRQSAYLPVCESVDEVGTLRQLAEWIDGLLAA